MERWDSQYIFLAILGIFSLCVIDEPWTLCKDLLWHSPHTQSADSYDPPFFLPFLPIAGWLVFFYACKFITGEYRPPIWVRVLPALENILYVQPEQHPLRTQEHILRHFGLVALRHHSLRCAFRLLGLMFIFARPVPLPHLLARSDG